MIVIALARCGPASAPVRTLTVDLGPRSYPIHIGAGLLAQAGALLAPIVGGGRALVVADSTVAQRHGRQLLSALAGARIDATLVEFPAGETSKTLTTAERLWAACAEHRIDRASCVIGFGGGVSGDLAGYVAACWMRGIRFVQIPTTLLAMVDSAVGGKTGVDTAAGKNLVGAFHQPSAVIADPALLTTMPPREYRAGLAEVLKYGVIRDPGFLAWQEANATALRDCSPDAVAHAVYESCRIKAWYVHEDETEQGVRAELNYGHTFGHALENHAGYAAYLHGEAVGIGMRMAVDLARRVGVLEDATLAARQDALLAAYGLPTTHRARDVASEAAAIVARMSTDKKASKGRVRFILPRKTGAIELRPVEDQAQVIAAVASAIARSVD
ncbi:MAG: 3-dehydroquinate synthase [Planctomycetota bacterium]